jgi:CMP/dCMP kinase
MRITVAIDGPAASGKGTLARQLAASLGVPHLDTGTLYRAVGRLVLDRGEDPANGEAATASARALTPQDLSRDDLRGPVADSAAAAVASEPGVRAALLDFQRAFAENGAVLDGRDIGTVVLPQATIKFFVTARLEVRALRRQIELQQRGAAVPLDLVRAEMAARDEADRNRAAAPLRPAEDAIELDTSDLSAGEALAAAEQAIKARLAQPAAAKLSHG